MVPKIKLSSKNTPFQARPREKLLAKGSKYLTDVELLAILLGTGCAKSNVMKLSDSLLKQIPIQKLSSMPMKELTEFPGVGCLKAVRILAALELGERIYSPECLHKVIINTTKDTIAELRDFSAKKQEHLIALYLNARLELIGKEIIGIGSLSSLMITPKEIFSPALLLPCTSIIVAHNHPSGDPNPSEDDIKFTKRIHEAGEVMGIHLLDHIVLGKSSWYSFRDDKIGI